MIKFDFHTHVGQIPTSAKNGTFTIDLTAQQAADFITTYGITHTVILYSEYDELEKLSHLVPNTKLYGVKWINDPEFDELDHGKPLCWGVKLHSHRSRYVRNGVETFGLDYTDARLMGKILDRLNPGELVYMHTQESLSPLNKSCPRAVLKNARKYIHLKFIIGHAGHYGGFAVARPVDRLIDTTNRDEKSEDKKHLHGLSQYLLAKQNTLDAAIAARYHHNIFLDSSVYTSQKAEVLAEYGKWCVGSDFPFGSPDTYNFDKQVKQFLKHMPMEKIEQQYQEALHWIETPVQQLAQEHYDSEYTNKGTPRKRKGYVPGREKE